MPNTATNTANKNDIFALIYAELEKVNDQKLTLTPDTDITTDMSVDSVTIMDLVFELEEKFDVSVPLNDLADTRTIGQLADLVAGLQDA